MADKAFPAYVQGFGVGLALATIAGAVGDESALTVSAVLALGAMALSYVLEKRSEHSLPDAN